MAQTGGLPRFPQHSTRNTEGNLMSREPAGAEGAAPRARASHLEIRPGEGGDDAALFAAELTATFAAYAARRGWPCRARPHDGRTHVLDLTGVSAREFEEFTGVHRVQRVPVNDKRGRRQTSTATVAALDVSAPAVVRIDPGDVRVDRTRGSGPGGQHRNKVSTTIRLVHEPTGTVIMRDGRSQAQNLTAAWADLNARLSGTVHAQAAERTDERRREQVTTGERSAKAFTHNTQRGSVVSHASGRTWTLKAWSQGRLDG